MKLDDDSPELPVFAELSRSRTDSECTLFTACTKYEACNRVPEYLCEASATAGGCVRKIPRC